MDDFRMPSALEYVPTFLSDRAETAEQAIRRGILWVNPAPHASPSRMTTGHYALVTIRAGEGYTVL